MREDTYENYEELNLLASQFRKAGDRASELIINHRLLALDLSKNSHLWPLPEHSEDMEWN